MASTRGNTGPAFILTPQQQNLLFRALTSNQPGTTSPNNSNNAALSLSPESLTTSPGQNQKNSGAAGTQESPFFDYDYDFGPDSSFDFDFNDGQAKMIGELPGATGTATSANGGSNSSSPERETSTDKRSLDEDDSDDMDEGGGKRRESEGKVPKKPGRKPLTNEPSSKRKAQNRAAQRAFRERKEKHLKDLETKVEELEKASAATNNENSQLRAQVDKMTTQLNEYKKRLSLVAGNTRSVSGPRNHAFGSAAIQNINDVNFQFEFPKFGSLPGPSPNSNEGNQKSAYPSPSASSGNGQNSPSHKANDKVNDKANSQSNGRNNSETQSNEAPSKFSGIFNNNTSPYENMYGVNASRTSVDSATFSVNGANGASPSASSNCNTGPSSSCGTSPEPSTQSPGAFKPLDTLTTIGEEQPSVGGDNSTGFGNFGTVDFGNLDWLSQQNGGQFDPQLFGDYREPQNNILANTTFDDSFFNDAFDVDFTTPFNTAPAQAQNANNSQKKNLIEEIDARKEMMDEVPPVNINGKLLTCNNIWEKLQTCPKVQNGDLDLDGLCSDLQKKAKCGGTGAVVEEHDFKTIMTKYLGPDARCPTEEEGK